MNVINLIFLSLLSLIPALVSAQGEISFDIIDKSTVNSPINNIYDSFKEGDKTIVLCDTRNKGDLDILISVFDSLGNKIEDKIIGEKGAFERPVTLLEGDNKNKYLLSNVFENGEPKLILFTLDEAYTVIDKKTIPVKNLSEGNCMLLNGPLAIIAVSILDHTRRLYPSIIKYNIETSTIEKQYDLKKQNNPLRFVDQRIISKEANRIQFSKNAKEEIVLLGYETSDEITDFWACKIRNGMVAWEKNYTSKIGGDEGVNLFPLDNGNYILSGIGYTKTKAENYQIRSLLIDKEGTIIKQQNAKTKTRTFYKNGIKLPNNNYAFLGQSELIEYTGVMFGEKILATDISLFVYNEQLEIKAETNFKIERLSKILNIVAFSDNLVGVFYKENNGLSLMKLMIK